MKDPNDFFENYPKDQDIFDFDKLKARPLYTIIPYEAELEFHRIATTLSLNSDVEKKYSLINDLARRLDLTLLARGTNRVVYTVNYDSSIVVKIGYDKAGITDSAREYENQQFIKPFCAKCFEVSPTGTVGLFERVVPIKHAEEFKSMAQDIFDMLYQRILGKYIMADIGMRQYMNYGFREGFGPVILDYPYLYELDPSKLKCQNFLPLTGTICGGTIEYDGDFEHLVCDRCGKEYKARDLAKELQHQKDREKYFSGLLEEEKKVKIKRYGSNAMFDSENGGKSVDTSQVISLPAPSEQQPIVSNEEAEKATEFISKEEAEKMAKEAYINGMVAGKNTAEQQQARRTFNPTGQTTPPPQKKSSDVNTTNPNTQQPKQNPVQRVEQKKTTETIPRDTYVPYRDPTPRGKSNPNYVGWQTPRHVGRGPKITDKSKAANPKPVEQPRDNRQDNRQNNQKPRDYQPRQQQQPKQQIFTQPKPNAPKPRDPISTPVNEVTPSKQPIINVDAVNRFYDYEFRGLPSPETAQNTPPKKEPSQQSKQPPIQQPSYTPKSSNSYDTVVSDKIMKHVICFCVDNAERRDDVIYELTYITTLYHMQLDPKFDVPFDKVTDLVRKIVDLIEEKLEGIGVVVEYEYEDSYTGRDNNPKPDNPYPSNPVFDNGGGAMTPITDDEEDRLNYDDRLRTNGISFADELVHNQDNDHISEEVGNIFNPVVDEQVKQVANNLLSNNANPKDTSTSQNLNARINQQLSASR